MNLDRITRTVTCAAEEAARRAQKGAIVGCVLATLGVTAFGFATAALYLALVAEMRPVYACLAVAGAYLVVALVVLLLARRGKGRRPARHPPPERRPPEPDAVSELIATFLAGVRAGREGFRREGSRRDDR